MKKGIAVVIIALFIVSAVSPMVIGFDIEINERVEPESIASSGPMDSAWPMMCYDRRHTSRSLYSTAHIDGLEKWRIEVDWVQDNPVIHSDGTIYVASSDWAIKAVYPNGTFKWTYKTGGYMSGSSPAIAEDGTIYVGSWDDYLHAINPDGTRKWRFLAHANIASSPVIAEDGTIYFGTMHDNGRIYAVNPDGSEKWYYVTGWSVTSDPAIGDDGTIYIGSLDSYLYALYPNGTLRWKFKTGNRIYGHPSIADDGTIYIGSSWDSYLYALYPNGTLKWKYKGAGTPSNPSIGSDGDIYAGYEGNLVALNPNGALKWSLDLGTNRWVSQSSPAVSADGTIYIGLSIGDAGGGEILAVNPDGTEKWRKKIAYEWVDSSPSIAEDGTVYIGSTYEQGRGYLHAFGPVESNSPPETPTILGETNGEVDNQYWYDIRAIDPDNNPISLFIDWGDGSEGWKRERASGEKYYYEHTWTEKSNYTIRAKAKDTLGEESDWAYLEVTMPKNQNMQFGWLENFPILNRLFNRFMEKLNI